MLSSLNTLHNFTNPKLQTLQMHGHFRFCCLIWRSCHKSSRCLCIFIQILMQGHFHSLAWLEISPPAVAAMHNSTNPICMVIFNFCRLIGNITICSNCCAQFYKSCMNSQFTSVAWLESLPSAVTAVHNSTNPICTVTFTFAAWLEISLSAVTAVQNFTNRFYSHFYFYRLIGNIAICSNCPAQ